MVQVQRMMVGATTLMEAMEEDSMVSEVENLAEVGRVEMGTNLRIGLR